MDPVVIRALAEVIGPVGGVLACGAIPITLVFLIKHFKLSGTLESPPDLWAHITEYAFLQSSAHVPIRACSKTFNGRSNWLATKVWIVTAISFRT